MDCLLNLSLLYDISSITGDSRYRDAAFHHAKQAQAYLVREDDSTDHYLERLPQDYVPYKENCPYDAEKIYIKDKNLELRAGMMDGRLAF